MARSKVQTTRVPQSIAAGTHSIRRLASLPEQSQLSLLPLSLFSLLHLSPIDLDRQRFSSDLANNPRNVLSPIDVDIQRNCDSLVPTLYLADDMVDSKGSLSPLRRTTIFLFVP